MLNSLDEVYVYIDPFSQEDSGVSSYIKLSQAQLLILGISSVIIKREINESVNNFKLRVPLVLSNLNKKIIMVEAPESLACSEFIPNNIPLHIRLHFSRSLGCLLQHQSIKKDDIDKEQTEINRASVVSSPSRAAYHSSCEIFEFPKKVIFFPNPNPLPLDNPRLHKYDVLFIGRYQKLKGISYLEDMMASLPHLKFLIATNIKYKESLENKFKNVTVIDGVKNSKPDIYHSSQVVVVPSMFETSSMVILEAFSYNCKIIAWEHLGALEYDGLKQSENIYKVKIFNVHSFKDAVIKALSSELVPAKNIFLNNQQFSEGIFSVIKRDVTFESNISEIDMALQKEICGLFNRKKNWVEGYMKSPIVRKTRKLFRDPKAFFNDSHFFNGRKKNEKALILESSTSTLIKEYADEISHSDSAKELLHHLIETEIIDANHESVISIEDNEKYKLYCVIGEEGRLEFPEPRVKPKGHTVAFFYSKNELTLEYEDIIDNLNSFEDFKYTSLERMHIGCFSLDKNITSLSVINRIDVKNKNRFSLIDFCILANPPVALCTALRSIGTDQKIIVIDTSDESVNYSECADVVISIFPQKEMNVGRRFIAVNSINSIHIAIRKVLQENFPKNPNMLIALRPEDQAFNKQEFKDFDDANFDGIIKVNKFSSSGFQTMDDYYLMFSKNILGIAVKESVYNKYKNLVQDINIEENAFHFVRYCLADGVIFDVKEI
jgi:hypothetical protein